MAKVTFLSWFLVVDENITDKKCDEQNRNIDGQVKENIEGTVKKKVELWGWRQGSKENRRGGGTEGI